MLSRQILGFQLTRKGCANSDRQEVEMEDKSMEETVQEGRHCTDSDAKSLTLTKKSLLTDTFTTYCLCSQCVIIFSYVCMSVSECVCVSAAVREVRMFFFLMLR